MQLFTTGPQASPHYKHSSTLGFFILIVVALLYCYLIGVNLSKVGRTIKLQTSHSTSQTKVDLEIS